jgi:uncharacterized protein (TIGR02996 family)
MTQDEAFLHDIIEHPDDDTPRLVYADWLEDNGDPERAEFIRVQIRLVREPDNHPERQAWLKREKTLLRAGRKRWAAALQGTRGQYRFHRGFVEYLRVDATSLLSRGDRPWRQPLRMLACPLVFAEELRRLAALPQLARLAVLDVGSTTRSAGFAAFVSSPHLSGLRGLGIEASIGVGGLEGLLASSVVGNLTHLRLQCSTLRMPAIEQLARSERLRRLVALDLSRSNLASGALRALDSSPHMANLRRLGFSWNRLGDAGLEAFVRLPLFARLQYLDLGSNSLTARSLRALAAAPALAGLRALSLAARMEDEAVLALVRSPHLHPQARLALWGWPGASRATRREAVRLLGSRVRFEHPRSVWKDEGIIDWPLWQPHSSST